MASALRSNVQDELSTRLCMESNVGQRALLSLWGSGRGPEGPVPESSADKAGPLSAWESRMRVRSEHGERAEESPLGRVHFPAAA